MWEKRKVLCKQSDAIADAVMWREKGSCLQKYWVWRVSVDFNFDIVEVVGERWGWRRPRLGLQDCPALAPVRVVLMEWLGWAAAALHCTAHGTAKAERGVRFFPFFFLGGGKGRWSSCCTVTAAGSQ